MARDLGETLGKDITILTEGSTRKSQKHHQRDRGAADAHSFRNAIDHGWRPEKPGMGKKKGFAEIVASTPAQLLFIPGAGRWGAD